MSSNHASSPRGFRSFNLDRILERNLRDAGYDEPRPVQQETIPSAMKGRDILGLAQTGTGKTAAFALPILHRILANRDRKGPRALVVAPTRELAIQIDGEFRKLAKGTRIRTVLLYGGVSDRAQIQILRRRPDVIVACPGRLLDLYNRRQVPLENVETLVLDEADHMFDMGFLPDIRRITAALPAKRQNLLFGATMPREVRHLAEEMLRQPYVAELAHTAPAKTIDHAVYPVREARKKDMLEHFLSEDGFVSAIVFARTKHRARKLAEKLEKGGYRAIALQGNMSQSQRDRAMNGFRNGRYDVLVATDIAARGIDVEQVSHVINFDIPNTPEAYTHRIGRTGRSERSGRAFTFITEQDCPMVRSIEKMIGRTIRVDHVSGFEQPFQLRRPNAKRPNANKKRPQGRAASGPRRGRRGRARVAAASRGRR